MIQKFVDHFMANKGKLEEIYSKKHPENYKEIVTNVVRILSNPERGEYGMPSAERIIEIDHGDYQGTLLYVIGADGYQPDDYWYVKINYGSCSGCDTLQAIESQHFGDIPSPLQVEQYVTLSLHVVQKMKQMEDVYV